MPLRELIERYGSPLYLYELEAVREAYAALRAALPQPTELYYSVKANPHRELVRELGRCGCGTEVSSMGEIRTALEAGMSAARCLYTGPGKSASEVAQALAFGIRRFSVDSLLQLQSLDNQARRVGSPVDVLLRINPDRSVAGYALEMAGGASQFGADTSWVLKHPKEFMSTSWARVRGFHVFMGANVRDPGTMCRIVRLAVDEVSLLSAALGLDLAWVDLGGGFAHPFAQAGQRPDYSMLAHELSDVLDGGLPGWRHGNPVVAFESGRYLVGGAGTLLCTVQDVKVSKGRVFVVVDSGIHHLGGMSGLRRIPQMSPTLLGTWDSECGEHPYVDADVVGSLCTPLDSWARQAKLPQVSAGDVLAIPNVGAYGLTASLVAFLSHEMPCELILEGGSVSDISRLVLTRVNSPTLDRLEERVWQR